MYRLFVALAFIVIVAASMGAACLDPPPLHCLTYRSCVSGPSEIQGLCLIADDGLKYCAFPATDCPSLWRWDFTAGDYADKCVAPALIPPDAGADGFGSGMDGSTTDALSEK